MSESDEFYIQNISHHGDLVLWWGPKSCGYTSNIENAGVYTRAEAASIVRNRPTQDFAFRKDLVDTKIRRVVFRESLRGDDVEPFSERRVR